MAYSSTSYRGTGSLTDFTFQFPYISKENVKVFVDRVEVPFTFINSSAVRVTPAPANGTSVVIKRVSAKDTVPVAYADGSTLLENDLDLSVLWNLYVAQESDDIAQDLLGKAGAPLEDAVSAAVQANSSAASANSAAANAANTAAALLFTSTPNGASVIGYQAPGTGSVARTLADELGDMRINVKRKGALGIGIGDDTAAVMAAVTEARSSPNKPSVYFPPGRYVLDTMALESLRGVTFEGADATDPVSSYGKTWIYWKSGSTAAHLLGIRSCAFINFRRLNFFSNGNTGKECMVRFQVNGQSTALPRNKFASSFVGFEDCAFVVSTTAPCTVATVWQKSSLLVTYKRCVLFGTTALKLGADTDTDPDTGEATIPDGRAVATVLENCSLRGNIVRERVLGMTLVNNYFDANSVPFATDSYRMTLLTCSGNQEVRREVIRGNTLDTANVTHNSPAWYTGPQPVSSGVKGLLVAEGNQVNGVGVGFDVYSGSAAINGNEFLAENKPGVSVFSAFRLNDGVTRWQADGNVYGLLALNSGSVVAQVMSDNRTTIEDRKYLLARGRASDLVLANTNYTQVLGRTLDYLEGGPCEVSYGITITSAIDSTFTARLVLDGVPIPNSYTRFTTNSASSKTFTLVLSPRVLFLSATSLAATRVLELQIKQETGTTWATVRGDASGLGDTRVLVKSLV